MLRTMKRYWMWYTTTPAKRRRAIEIGQWRRRINRARQLVQWYRKAQARPLTPSLRRRYVHHEAACRNIMARNARHLNQLLRG